MEMARGQMLSRLIRQPSVGTGMTGRNPPPQPLPYSALLMAATHHPRSAQPYAKTAGQ